jgi:signal transduction histidine kinase/HAMP domain-containing protein
VIHSIRRFVAVAIAAAGVLAVLVLGSAWRIVHRVPEAVEELSRLQIAEHATARLGSAFGDLEQTLLARAGYGHGDSAPPADATTLSVHLLLNDLRITTDGLPAQDEAEALQRLTTTVLTTPGRRPIRGMDRPEAVAALERLAAAQAALARLRTSLTEATAARRDLYRRARAQVRWLTAAAAAAGLLLAAFVFASARRHFQTLRTVTDVARSVARGDFQRRVPHEGVEELREVGAALNAAVEGVAERDRWLQNALTEAERRRHLLSATIDATSDGIVMYDVDGEIAMSSRRCAELFSIAAEELNRTSARQLRDRLARACEAPERFDVQLAAHFRAAGPHQDVLVLREPARRVLRRSSAPIPHGDAFAGGRVFTFTDVTTEATLDRLKSEFVSMASHELRTPLKSIHGALQLAVAGSGDRMMPEDRELLDISLASTDRLVRLVNDLLDLSKIEAGRMPVRLERLDPARLVARAADVMRSLAQSHGITLQVACDGAPIAVVADADLLERVLTNLVSNAIKYSPPGSTVTIGSAPAGTDAVLFVDDEGAGIDPANADRLFKPFSRVGDQEYDRSGGTGLGLAISRAIVEQHDGRIWAEPRTAGGSRFAVRLAIAESLSLTGS